MCQQQGIQQLSVISLTTAIFIAATLSICPDTSAQMRIFRQGGNRSSQPILTSQPATVSIDSGSNIQSIPMGITNESITNASSFGSGNSTINANSDQSTTPTRATAIADTSIVNSGLNANVRTSATVVNTPAYVQGSGQSNAQVNGGTGIAATETAGVTNNSPSGNSARGFAFGSVRGRR